MRPRPVKKKPSRQAAQKPVIDWMREQPRIEKKWLDDLIQEVSKIEKKYGL